MRKCFLVGLVFAVLCFVAANVKADLAPILYYGGEFYTDVKGGNDYTAFVGKAAKPDWDFANLKYPKNSKDGSLTATFEVEDLEYHTAIGSGSFTLSHFDNNGTQGWNVDPKLVKVPVIGMGGDPLPGVTLPGFSFDQVSAGSFLLEFVFDPGLGISAFSFEIAMHTGSGSGTLYEFEVNGLAVEQGAKYPAGWFGFILDDGEYLESLKIKSVNMAGDYRNNGFDLIFAIGGTNIEEPPVVPEPATLALMGLGLAGVGLVARRRMKK